MVYPRDYPEEHVVVKDAEYFDELRRAVSRTSPTALFGTSGLAVYQSIESAQDLELREQLPAEVHKGYHSAFKRLRIATTLIPWVSLLAPIGYINPSTSALPAKGASGPHPYEPIVALALGVLVFIIAKFIQLPVWRIGSAAIRHKYGISSNSRRGDATSESDVPD